MKLETLEKRRSVRSFTELPIDKATADKLKAEITMVNTHEAGISFHLVLDHPDALGGFKASYGFFRNARNYIVAVVDYSYNDVLERSGFFAERLVLAATEMGLATCYVGATFSKSAIDVPLRAGQEIPFIIAVGHEDNLSKGTVIGRLAGKIIHRTTMKPEDFYVERKGWPLDKAMKSFPQLREGLRAVACSPSSYNKRPVRVWVGQKGEENVLRIGVPDLKERQLIDLGIAKSNFCATEGGIFDWGNGAPYYPEE